ncbi:MAG: hypothetical protein KatS3mg060_0783 [Dehalococcoidia bacterium]|nr:MAG: hypothetical protein KatS3mg060_0783 [Dehalococcoidia bacterium]
MTALEVSVRHQLAGFRLSIDLAADREVLVLFGRSGAGKSMALRTVAGLVRPAQGRIMLNGRVLFDDKSRIFVAPQARRVGYVPQSYALFPHLNVYENVAFGVRGVSNAEARRRIEELLELTGLISLQQRRPHQLSGGQQQRVALARALVTQPEALLLDEPLSALDSPTRIELRRALRSLQRRFAIPTLFVTHDLSEALYLGDRIAVLDHGRVLQEAPPDELLLRFRDVRVAELVGVRNIWRGRIERLEGDRACVRVGERTLIGRAVSESMAVGDPVWVCVRSDRIRLDAQIDHSFGTSASGTIVDAVADRSVTVLYVKLADARLTPEREFDLEVEVPQAIWERAAIGQGAGISLIFPPEEIRILPVAATEHHP